ncbi:FHA domain-containing protein [Rubrobacter taiwanensis]|uniref:NADH:ubiquinone reductase (non-electrogenic) n=1 Tax=Rubrobacter taiwanensis TaxID=185139 RepID=A0A4R1BQ61_9ACTN|nr:FAD-dependent oxidoreductase [Rubrobacter taiwanensis]TCJ19829.1 FHA domain-containing protein [Rubrobacter taiwanensis]
MIPVAPQKTRVLILGGGFGGIATAQGLSKAFKRDPAVEITLINRDNYFVFVPLLASAAAGSVETMHVVAPIRRLIPGVRFRAEEITGIDPSSGTVTTSSPVTGREHRLSYDHLVLALGNRINLSRLPGVAQHGKTIKTLGDAISIRNHVLQMLEAADIETDPAIRRAMLTFVVAGGGFSGVEMVGELNDLVREAIEYYPSISREQLRVVLLHSGDRILPEMGAEIAGYALKQLRKRGVEVRLRARLAGATPRETLLEGGARIATRTLIVAVGNAPPTVLEDLDVPKERGRIAVDDFMQVLGHPGLWALGDNAVVPNRATKDGSPSPPTAQYALRQGKALAHNIGAAIRGGRARPFAFGGLGLLCTVGHGAGVGELPLGIKTRGMLGWLLWRSVYWSKAPSLGRKLQIGADWFLDLFLKRDIAQINLSRTQTVGRAHYEAGEYIFRQGDPGDHFYMIASGEVEVIRERSSGAKEVLARLSQGEYFGETALLTRARRNASVRCATPVDVITIGRDDFATLAGAWQQLASSLKETSEQRVSAAPLTAFLPVVSVPDIPETSPARSLEEPAVRRIAQLRRDSGAEIDLDRDLITIGRTPDNHIVVPDPQASRRHALIQRDGDAYRIDDLESTNGTWVNGERITEPRPLRNGDEILVGQTRFTFQATAAGSAPSGGQRPGSVTAEIHRLDELQREQEAGPVTGALKSLGEAEEQEEPRNPAAPPAARAALHTAGGRTFELGPGGATIGRMPDNSIRLDDGKLSRRHARIEFRDGGYWLSDLGSSNGTFVNGIRLGAPYLLRPGDTITCGDTQLVFRPAAEGESPERGSITDMLKALDAPDRQGSGERPS